MPMKMVVMVSCKGTILGRGMCCTTAIGTLTNPKGALGCHWPLTMIALFMCHVLFRFSFPHLMHALSPPPIVLHHSHAMQITKTAERKKAAQDRGSGSRSNPIVILTIKQRGALDTFGLHPRLVHNTVWSKDELNKTFDQGKEWVERFKEQHGHGVGPAPGLTIWFLKEMGVTFGSGPGDIDVLTFNADEAYARCNSFLTHPISKPKMWQIGDLVHLYGDSLANAVGYSEDEALALLEAAKRYGSVDAAATAALAHGSQDTVDGSSDDASKSSAKLSMQDLPPWLQHGSCAVPLDLTVTPTPKAPPQGAPSKPNKTARRGA